MENLENYYLHEFELFNGEFYIKFNIIDINVEKMVILLAVSNAGKISVIEYDLLLDKDNKLYFQYGIEYTKIKVEDFEKIED